MKTSLKALALVLTPIVLAGCGSMAPKMVAAPQINNASLPEAVRVPAGNVQSTFTTVGMGEITYECRVKPGNGTEFGWVFVAPVATLNDASGNLVGKYYAGPTWEANDGSKFTGKQVAVAPSSAGNLPLQLVAANPATGKGAFAGTTFVQRLNTKGGVAPSQPCVAASLGQKLVVTYGADYVLYKAQ